MNNKAFTLAELLVIIVILSVLAIITVPTIIDVINSSKKQTLDEQKRIIIDAANRWGTDNTKKLPTTSCDLTIDFLKKEGYLDSENEVVDPMTNKKMTGCVRITLDSANNQYNYKYIEKCSNLCN